MSRNLAVAMVASLFAPAALAQWTPYDPIMENWQNQMRQLDAQMRATENTIVQSNLNNPYIQQRYHDYRAAGGNLAPEQYAYMYGATAGFTPQGVATYNTVTTNIAQRDRAAVQDYHGYVNQLWSDTNAYRSEVNDRIWRGRGDVLSGSSTFANPQSGTAYVLPYTVPTHTSQLDTSGNQFYMDGQSNYWMSSGNGWWTQMQPQR